VSAQVRNNESLVGRAVGVAGALRCPPVDGSLCFEGDGYGAVISAARSPDSGTGVAQYHSIRYVRQCVGFAAPGSDVCRASLESAQYCAFGAGDTCRACPRGGYCPGGNEVRSFPDYYVLSSPEGIVEPCGTLRCVGWDMQRSETKCAVGYAGEHRCTCTHASAGTCALMDATRSRATAFTDTGQHVRALILVSPSCSGDMVPCACRGIVRGVRTVLLPDVCYNVSTVPQ
jgi:hypothetical protein